MKLIFFPHWVAMPDLHRDLKQQKKIFQATHQTGSLANTMLSELQKV